MEIETGEKDQIIQALAGKHTMNHFVFTIVTINFNNEKGLKKTIDSVLQQSFKDFEYIIVDGASSDGSVSVIKENEKRINSWVSEPDKGIYDAMNKGVARASGDYVLFLNSGDYLVNENVLLTAYNSIIATGKLDVYYGNVLMVRENDPVNFLYFKKVDRLFLFTNMICHQGIIAKRGLFEKFGGFDLTHKISADYDWFLKTFLNTSVTSNFLWITLCCYEVGGVSVQQGATRIAEREIIKQKYFSKTTILFIKMLRSTRLLWLLNRSIINQVIGVTSSARWKRLKLV